MIVGVAFAGLFIDAASAFVIILNICRTWDKPYNPGPQPVWPGDVGYFPYEMGHGVNDDPQI